MSQVSGARAEEVKNDELDIGNVNDIDSSD
jgi:hypothetical protein